MTDTPARPRDETDDWPVEEWAYAGVRCGKGDKPSHLWIDRDGKELHFTGRRRYVTGAIYQVRVNRKPDGGVTRTTPVLTDRREPDEGKRLTWAARDHAAGVRIAASRRERNALKHNELQDAVDPLVEIARTLRTGADRDAFLAYIIRRVNTAWPGR